MTWTITNLVIEIIAGIIGGHGAAAASKEHSFGVLGHTIAGAVGGAISGYFLQTLVGTVVNGTGDSPARRPTSSHSGCYKGSRASRPALFSRWQSGSLKHSIDQHRVGKI